jgi:hypothetical protein
MYRMFGTEMTDVLDYCLSIGDGLMHGLVPTTLRHQLHPQMATTGTLATTCVVCVRLIHGTARTIICRSRMNDQL